MTPKEKAIELVKKFDCGGLQTFAGHDVKKIAKECALIAVDEILNELLNDKDFYFKTRVHYWQEVKQEIEKL